MSGATISPFSNTFRELQMRHNGSLFVVMIALFTSAGLAFQVGTDGPYKVLKTAKVGGEGGTDYIYADTAGRRLYITRGATQAQRGDGYEAGGARLRKAADDLRSRHACIGGSDSGCWRQRRDGVPEDGPRLHQRPSPTLDVRRQDHEVDQDDRSSGGIQRGRHLLRHLQRSRLYRQPSDEEPDGG